MPSGFRLRPGPVTVAVAVLLLGLAVRLGLRAANASPTTFDAVRLTVFAAGVVVLARLYSILRKHQASADHLAAIIESTDDAIIAKDLEGIVTSWNPGAERLFGYAASEAIGQPITAIVPPERLAEERSLLARIRGGERVDHFETVRRRKDGTSVDVSIAMSPVIGSGRIVGISTIARDITERRRIDRLRNELLDRETLLRADAVDARDRLAFLADVSAVLTSTLDYQETLNRSVHLALPRLGDYCNMYVLDEHNRMRHASWGHVDAAMEPAVREMGQRVADIQASDLPQTFAAAIVQSGRPFLATPATLQETARRLERQDAGFGQLVGRVQPYAYVGVPLLVRGRVIGVMSFGSTVDASHREYSLDDLPLLEEFARRVSMAVENARLFRHLDELNRLKDEFLATLSHELRTPVSAVLGWSRLLASGQLEPEKSVQAVAAIERNAQAQASLVDDILDVARGMAGNLRLDMAPVDLSRVAHRGIEAIAPAATVKRIHIDIHTPAPVVVIGDAGRLQQVVWNLLTNAVKFTPSGGRVTIDVAAGEDGAELRVTDTGVGIPAAFLPFVFDKFRQADASFTRQYGGLGLGLAIARHIVELHAGSIEARSDGEGLGATFVVRLPAPAD